MYHDSAIAEKVMLELVNRDVCVLPIHDSFIVQARYKDLLLETMSKCYEESVGYAASIR
jgi:hypothetical protein